MEAPKTKKRFRICSTKIFLTYPQCPLTTTEARDQLLSKSALASATGHVIAREKHADGNHHLHCYIEAETPMSVSSATELDLTGADGTNYHGNYQTVRSRGRVLKYVTKESDYVTNLELTTTVENPWKRARELASEEGLSSALAHLEENPKTARDLCLNGDRIQKNLATLTTKRLKITFDLSTFGWNVPWDSTGTTLLLYGPTNCGKTSLAKALLPDALLTRHLDKLRDYSSGRYTGIILDDMTFGHIHDEAQIALIDRHEDTQVHVRYSVAEIPAGTPMIVTSNKHPAEVFKIENPAIKRRLTFVKVEGVGKYLVQ